jgi:hypothetical protein
MIPSDFEPSPIDIRILKRRQWIGMAMFALLFVTVLLGMSDDKVQDKTTVKRLQVVDQHGQAVVEFTAGEHGGRIVLRSAGGKDVVRIEANAMGGAVLTFQSDGQPATELMTYQMNAAKRVGGLNIFDWKGRATVSLGTGYHGGGPVSMGAHCPGGVLVLDDASDMMRVDLCLLKELSELLGRK